MVADVGRGGAALRDLAGRARRCSPSPRRPIVLLRRRPRRAVGGRGRAGQSATSASCCPTRRCITCCCATCEGMPLVMTSGNRSDEPIAYEDADALAAAGGHRRPVPDARPADPRPLRRLGDARGRRERAAGAALAGLRAAAARRCRSLCRSPILAVGGQLKATFALGRGRPRVPQPSPRRPRPLRGVPGLRRSDVDHYEQLFAVAPGVHRPRPAPRLRLDALRPRACGQRGHPTSWPCSTITRTWPSCMAEHGLDEPVIGVTFDGTGFGTDGAIWGGEFLVGDYRGYPPGGPSPLRRHARRRPGHPRALADGGLPTWSTRDGPPNRSRRTRRAGQRRCGRSCG